MSINFHPAMGSLLMCDFNTGFKPPEMVKVRPVVVLSNRLANVCTVVPLSTTEPNVIEKFHHEMDPISLPGKLAAERTWAKCDMVTTVGFFRLDRYCTGRNKATGRRVYFNGKITADDLRKIQDCILHVLGLSHLQSKDEQPIITPSPERGLRDCGKPQQAPNE
jgi:uncharacterized protein YifN (PemK superfamily)